MTNEMKTTRTKVREARDIHKRHASFDEEQLERAIKLLAEHELWSMAQIASITGAPKTLVYKLVTKTDHTGGRFNPESFDLIWEEIQLRDRRETNRALTARILDEGTSSYMLAKLISQPVATVKWRAAEHRKAVAAAGPGAMAA